MAYIKICNVSKNYKDGDNVYLALKNINLEFDKNEFVAILGESGSGKSTLLNLILGITNISKGNIYIDNESIKNFSHKRMRQYRKKEIGVIFQKYNLIDLFNIYDNIDIVRNKNIDKNKINKLLSKIGIYQKKNSKISENSGGELQRGAAIRAIINNPSILICDEPTGALDNENSEILMNYLMSIKENKLIIFVTHNQELANKYASRIIELKDGQVVKDRKNNNQIKINSDENMSLTKKLSLKHKLIYIKNLIYKKKGRFLISILSNVFLLFFICISLMTLKITNEYINHSFLSSLDANIIDLKSYKIKNKELIEIELPTLVINELNKNNKLIIRKNLNKILTNNLLPKLKFKNNNININLNNIKICCTSSYSNLTLKKGKNPVLPNEVIINENLYNYLNDENSLINKRFGINNTNDYLEIAGVSYSSLMNDSLVIYFDYDLIKNYFKNEIINDYQIVIKNINNFNEVINNLKNSNFYIDRSDIKGEEINFSFEYNVDLGNYYTFYEMIKMAKVVVYFFLGLTVIISIMLLSNVIYSFNEEEKKNIALLKILGFSFYDIGSISILLSIIISLISLLIILIINKYLNIFISPIISQILNNELIISLTLSFKEYLIIYILLLLFSLLSSIFPLAKINSMKINNILKEE